MPKLLANTHIHGSDVAGEGGTVIGASTRELASGSKLPAKRLHPPLLGYSVPIALLEGDISLRLQPLRELPLTRSECNEPPTRNARSDLATVQLNDLVVHKLLVACVSFFISVLASPSLPCEPPRCPVLCSLSPGPLRERDILKVQIVVDKVRKVFHVARSFFESYVLERRVAACEAECVRVHKIGHIAHILEDLFNT